MAKRLWVRRKLWISMAGACVLLAGTAIRARAAQTMRLVATIRMDNVKGRIDHFGIDLKGNRLFLSALGNDTVEVFDLRSNRRLHTIRGLHEPQGTTYAPHTEKLYVANGGDGTVRVFDGNTYQALGVLHFSSDADDTRYDAETRRVYVGYGEGGIAAIDTSDDKVTGEIKLPAHPEAYEVEPGGGKIFINVPDEREIVVADWSGKRITARWPDGRYEENFPMALDASEHRLFVVTRRPAQLLVLNSDSGNVIAQMAVVGDADDVWYDARLRRIYVTGGEGAISVVAERDADHYAPVERIPTAPGARTSFFCPQLGRLYVAVPRRGAQPAEVRVYATQR